MHYSNKSKVLLGLAAMQLNARFLYVFRNYNLLKIEYTELSKNNQFII